MKKVVRCKVGSRSAGRLAIFAAVVFSWVVVFLLSSYASASSHREAPFITENPKVDGTDFYLFRSYESGRDGFVTMIANYLPLQDAYGGPNYFDLDPNARYAIKIDNNGDGREDIEFRFEFMNLLKGITLNIGGVSVAPSLVNLGPIRAMPDGAVENSASNILQFYTIKVIYKGDEAGAQFVLNPQDGSIFFPKPADYSGTKTFPNYPTYAALHVRNNVVIPGCAGGGGRVFVGQRREGFVVNLGETFDLANYNFPAPADGTEQNTVANKNITSIALEVPISCLTAGSPIVGGWTTASLPRTRNLIPEEGLSFGASAFFPLEFYRPALETGPYVQVSRLGMPLVNEVLIGLGEKDKFNGSSPVNDRQFLVYFTNPTLPKIVELLFGPGSAANIPTVKQPNIFPRADLVQVFLTGVPGLNQTTTLEQNPAEMQRLNTAIAPTPLAQASTLGVIGGDLAGFPNGRRVFDDVVDIELRVAMGALFAGSAQAANAPAAAIPFGDGAKVDKGDYLDFFPYLNTPVPGSPDGGSLN